MLRTTNLKEKLNEAVLRLFEIIRAFKVYYARLTFKDRPKVCYTTPCNILEGGKTILRLPEKL
jgi:hypothetical protein